MARFAPTTPPYAEIGSAACALRYAAARDPARATPHGFVCFTTTAARPSNSKEIRTAAPRTVRLLYEGSFPVRRVAVATPADRHGTRYRAACALGSPPDRTS